MKLRITDPLQIVIDRDVASVRAEDASGSFGILPGHADLLTALEISVVSWRDAAGTRGYCAVRKGILRVSDGNTVAIATREAHAGDDLDQLEAVVLAGYRRHEETERTERTASAKLRMQAIRRMVAALDGRLPEVGA
ncbi:MAG: F0F1 ATP synthase subunit epsilon [Sphingomonas sp.]